MLHCLIFFCFFDQQKKKFSRSTKLLTNEDITTSCVNWSLVNVMDECIILEAAQLLISSFNLGFVQRTAIEHNTFQIFFIQFLKSIQGVDVKNTNVVSTYITAIYYFLLVLPLKDIQYELFVNFLSIKGIPNILLEITEFKFILAYVHMHLSGNSLHSDNYLNVGKIFIVACEDAFCMGYNMSFMFLIFSFLNTEKLSKEDRRLSIEFIHRCTQNISIRRTMKLIYWILSGEYGLYELYLVESRWDTYSP